MVNILNGIFLILLIIMMFESVIWINLIIIDLIRDLIKNYLEERKNKKIIQKLIIKR